MKYLIVLVVLMIAGMSLLEPKNVNLMGATPYQGAYAGQSSVIQ